MENGNLQVLIEVLKKQGLDSGEEGKSRILTAAQAEAEEIVRRAEAEAVVIKAEADKEADRRLKRLNSALEIAASKFVNELRRFVEQSLLAVPLKKEIDVALADPKVLRGLLSTLVASFAADQRKDSIKLLLPADSQADLKEYALDLIRRGLTGTGASGDLVVESKSVKVGFIVDKKQGNVRLDFSDEAFLSLFLEFLSPEFRQLFNNFKAEL
ncbi:MAG: hypothetical protein V1816_23220 [Pseudomonadota bacterium]